VTWTLSEGLVDRVMAQLRDKLDERIASVNREAGDGLELDNIAAFEIAEPQAIAAYPTVLVLVDSDELVPKAGASFREHAKHQAQMTIIIVVLDQDTETLKRKTYRYARATWEALVDGQTDGQYNVGVGGQNPRFSYSPLFTQESGKFDTDCQIMTVIGWEETR
jgi:hypothetical protein